MSFSRVAVSVALLVIGMLLALYGVVALTFDEEGGPTYVTFAGHRLDAHAVGAVSSVIGLALVAGAVALMRRHRTRP